MSVSDEITLDDEVIVAGTTYSKRGGQWHWGPAEINGFTVTPQIGEVLDEVARQRRMFAALAQVNAWRDGWMSRAAAEMHTVLDAHQDGEPVPASAVQCMEALIAEWWDEDGEDGDE